MYILLCIIDFHFSLIQGHFQRVNFVALHPWQHELYSGGNDRNLVVWTYGLSPRESAYEQFLEDKRKQSYRSDIGDSAEGGGGGDGGRRGDGFILKLSQEGSKENECGQIQAYMDAWSDYSDDEKS